jgi:16S rRNA processing protein RimM
MNLFNYQPIAKISSLSGFYGAVKLLPLSRYFEEYIVHKYFMLGHSKLNLKKITLEKVKGVGKKRIFIFGGYNTVTDAESIKGKTLFTKVSRDDKINLISEDLIGWSIIAELGQKVGELIDVMWLPNNDVYIIKNGDNEYLIPVIDEIIKQVNYDRKEILINSIDGLLD